MIHRSSAGSRLVCAVLLLTPAATAAAQEIDVRVDARVELFGVLFQMAGRKEYNMTRLSGWQTSVDGWFDSASAHPAVEMTRRLARTYGVGYFVPMTLAVHLTAPPALAERMPFERAPTLHRAWTTFPDSTAAYLNVVRDFARATDFESFMAENSALVDTTESRLRRLIAQHVDVQWIEALWGEPAPAHFVLVPGLLNGRASYGVEYQPDAGEREIYAITGVSMVGPDGLPLFEPEFARVIVHEFSHAYANGLIDAHRTELAEIGEALYAPVADRMRQQAYGSWESMLYEALVRAAVVRYVAVHEGAAAAEAEIAEQADLGFVWSEALDELLREYENGRGRYASVRSFMPRIIAFFRDWIR